MEICCNTAKSRTGLGSSFRPPILYDLPLEPKNRMLRVYVSCYIRKNIVAYLVQTVFHNGT